MLAEERFALILEQLNEQRTVTVQQLCEALHTSESTIRRDLTELDRQGRLTKVHGGATLPDSRFLADEPTMEAKETLAVAEKRSIAAAAAALVAAEDFVFIDAGTTTLELVRALAGAALKATYVTNGVAHARLLAQKGCRVYLPGGLLRPQTEAIVGAPAVSSIQQYNFTKAFMGANGVALEAGFTTPDPEEAAVKAAAVRRARESWFLVDDAKFAKIYPAVITELHGGAILTKSAFDSVADRALSPGYIVDKDSRIVYHSDENYNGMKVTEYQKTLERSENISLPLKYFGWRAYITLDLGKMNAQVNEMYGKSIYLYMLLLCGC